MRGSVLNRLLRDVRRIGSRLRMLRSSTFESLFGRRSLSGAGPFGNLLRRHRLDVDDAGPRLDHPGEQREVLAQRESLEPRGQVHVAQVGMSDEVDPEHLVGFPLVPVGAGVDRLPGVDGHRLLGDVGLDRHADVPRRVRDPGEHLEARLTAGDPLLDRRLALRRWLRRVVFAAPERRRLPVQRRQEAEVREAHRAERPPGRRPAVGAHADPQVVLRREVVLDEGVSDVPPQFVDDRLPETIAGQLGDGCLVLRDVTQSHHHPRRWARAWGRCRRPRRRATWRPCPRS